MSTSWYSTQVGRLGGRTKQMAPWKVHGDDRGFIPARESPRKNGEAERLKLLHTELNLIIFLINPEYIELENDATHGLRKYAHT